MIENKKLTELAEWLVEFSRKKGADEAEVSISQGREFDVEIRNGELENLVEAGDKNLSIRLFVDHRYASVNTDDFDRDVLSHLVERGIERARNSSQDPFSGLPEFDPNAEIDDWKKLEIYDEEITNLSPGKKISLARQTEKIAVADKRITNSYGSSFSDSFGEYILVNSNGFSGSFKRSRFSLGVYLQAGEEDKRVESGWYESSRFFNDLWTPEQVANEAVHRVTRLINPRKVKTKNVPVVMEPGMAASILSFLYQCLTGRAIYMKQSFLVDKLNEQIAAAKVNIFDDGLIKRGLGSRPFDAEGVPVTKHAAVKNGVLQTYLTDVYSARKLNMKSTGNGSGPNNFYLQKGNFSPDEIIRSVDNGLLLTHAMGQGTNPVTGDYSRGAFGLWIENGEVAYPVAEITISGNLGTMLQSIEMVGNDLRFNRSISAPTIKIAEMTVSGT
ncbi:MAG: TldD/PmbA family protein [Calditrichaeota bacterium]|nr:TldD/PmbA family protein [Calditrichota bacterium]